MMVSFLRFAKFISACMTPLLLLCGRMRSICVVLSEMVAVQQNLAKEDLRGCDSQGVADCSHTHKRTHALRGEQELQGEARGARARPTAAWQGRGQGCRHRSLGHHSAGGMYICVIV